MCTGGHTENARTNSSTSASCQGSNMVYLSSIMCHIMYIHMQILKYGWKNWLSSTQSHRCTSRCQKYNTCGCPPPEFLPRGMMFADMFLFPESAYLNIKTWTSLVPSALFLAPFLSLSRSFSLVLSLSLSLALSLSRSLSRIICIYNLLFKMYPSKWHFVKISRPRIAPRSDVLLQRVLQWVLQCDAVSVTVWCGECCSVL